MNELTEQGWAWKFVNGFDVPGMDAGKRNEWQRVISTLTQDQFQRAIKASRERPNNQLHMRPSIEAFKGYALAGEPSRPEPTYERIPRVDNTYDPRQNSAIVQARADLAKSMPHIERKTKTTHKPHGKTARPCPAFVAGGDDGLCRRCGWVDHAA